MLKFPETMIANEIYRDVSSEINSLKDDEIKKFYRKQNVLVDFSNRLLDEINIISPLQQKFLEMWIPYFALEELKKNENRDVNKYIYDFCNKMVELKGISSFQLTYIMYIIAEWYSKK